MDELDRREFLRFGPTALLGLAAAGPAAAQAPPHVRRPVRLRRALEVPDIGFGSSRLAGDEDLVRHALSHGITYFDTAESYMDASEKTLGRALRLVG